MAYSLVGSRFGRWTVLEYAGRWVQKSAPRSGKRQSGSKWLCRCDCGTERILKRAALTCGDSQSCGCYRSERIRQYRRSVGASSNRTRFRSEYRSWYTMKRRCLSPRDAGYRQYGARGITVCGRWLKSFKAFLEDMGPRPSPLHTLDRIDNDGNYEPANCRWALPGIQQSNKRDCRLVTFDGLTLSTAEWARRLRMRSKTIRHRLDSGWPIERALDPNARSRE